MGLYGRRWAYYSPSARFWAVSSSRITLRLLQYEVLSIISTFRFVSATALAADTTAGTATSVTAAGSVGTDGNTYLKATTVEVAIGATASETMQGLSAAMVANGVSAGVDSSGNITVAGQGVSAADVTAAAGAGITLTAGTGVALVSSNTSLAAAGTTGGSQAIDQVNAAIAKIGATLSQLGATTIQLKGLEDFTTQRSDSVSTGLGAMVDANLSAESAMLSSLQTKQSLAIQSLTLANQGPRSLLQLFR